MNEDVFPIEHGDLPASHVSFQGCIVFGLKYTWHGSHEISPSGTCFHSDPRAPGLPR